MGFKSTSTRRTSAASAVSSQAVVVNTGTGFTAVGSTVRANTAISLGVTTDGQTSASTVTTVSAGPVISNVAYLDANNTVTSANAVSTSGGNIRITGTGFVANSAVYINNTLATNTFVSSTQITAVCPAASAGNVAIMIFTPTDAGTQRANAIRYSGAPTWTTAAVALQNGIAANVSLIASSDSTLTYTLQDGSTLPTGISLNSAGYLTGTPTGYSGSTSVSAVIIATDAEGQAAQQTINISITSGDDQFKYTTLLLNGETSVTPFIKDSSSNNFGLTIAGDVRQDRFSPYYGNGYYSNSFNGSTDYFTVPSNAAFQLGTGDFTIELWFMIVGAGDNRYQHIIQSRDGTNNGFLVQYDRTNSTIELTSDTGFTGAISANSAVLDNTWYHFAATRSGSSVKIFLNGTQVGTTVTSAQNLTASGPVYVSRRWVTDGALHYVNGFISNLRILKGTALYTANFTPSTTPLTAIANTSLLTCQSTRFIDNSSNAFALTLAGTPKVSPAIPFAANSSYATYGSAYFDGTGDFLSTTANAAFAISGDYTIEAWVYRTDSGTQRAIIDLRGGAYVNVLFYMNSSNQLVAFNSTSSWIVSTGTIPLNQWAHVALTRSGTSAKLFINGVNDGTATNSDSNVSSGAPVIGRQNGSTTNDWLGYIADARVIKGTALYTSNFTPPTAPLAAVTNTQLLTCQYNGGAHNSGIVDNGPFNAIVTRNGNATQGTFSPFSPTGWSNYFVSGYPSIKATANAAFNFGTGDFTVEFWYYSISIGADARFISNDAYTGAGIDISYQSGSNRIAWYVGASAYHTGTLPTANQWHHVAFTRSGTTLRVFVDGELKNTYLNFSTNITSANDLYIGNYYNQAASLDGGYMSNVRLVKGTSLYNEAFTPIATPLTAVAGTSLLTCQDNRIIDKSPNNFALSVQGTVTVRAFSPFSPSVAYNPALHGGSVYLDGTGDFLSMPGSNITNIGASTSSAFTVEAWIYPTVAKDTTVIGCAGSAWRLALTSSRTVSWVFNTSSSQTSTDVIKLNQWNHIAFTYDGLNTGTSNKIFVNGIVQAAQGQLIPSSNTAGVIYVGRNADSAAWDFQGYISGARIIRGYAAYTANFTLPTAPFTSPLTTPASLLLNFTNGGVVDAHSSNNVETVGNAQLSTAVTKYGNASIYFDGTGDYIDVPNDVSNQLSGAVYTIEMWLYPTVGGVERRIFNKNGASTYGWLLSISTTDTIQFRTDSTNLSGGALTAPVNQWTHVAVTHDGTTTRIFVNGQLSTSATGVTITNANELGVMRIGSRAYQTGSFNYTGYMDDIRITKGVARYTANFTPPTTGHLGQ